MDFTIVICDKRAQLSYQFFDLKFGKLSNKSDDPLWMGWCYQSCKVNADPPFMG